MHHVTASFVCRMNDMISNTYTYEDIHWHFSMPNGCMGFEGGCCCNANLLYGQWPVGELAWVGYARLGQPALQAGCSIGRDIPNSHQPNASSNHATPAKLLVSASQDRQSFSCAGYKLSTNSQFQHQPNFLKGWPSACNIEGAFGPPSALSVGVSDPLLSRLIYY